MATHLWICDFCSSYSDESKSRVEKHEELCDRNPENMDDTGRILYNYDHRDEESRGRNQIDNEG